MKKLFKGLPPFTHGGEKKFQEILVTLGKKTKTSFIEAINKEAEETISDEHQMLNSGDILRVAEQGNFILK